LKRLCNIFIYIVLGGGEYNNSYFMLSTQKCDDETCNTIIGLWLNSHQNLQK